MEASSEGLLRELGNLRHEARRRGSPSSPSPAPAAHAGLAGTGQAEGCATPASGSRSPGLGGRGLLHATAGRSGNTSSVVADDGAGSGGSGGSGGGTGGCSEGGGGGSRLGFREKIEEDLQEMRRLIGSPHRQQLQQAPQLQPRPPSAEHAGSPERMVSSPPRPRRSMLLEDPEPQLMEDHTIRLMSPTDAAIPFASDDWGLCAVAGSEVQASEESSTARHDQELVVARKHLAQLEHRLGEQGEQLSRQATLREQLDYLERLLGDLAERHGEQLASIAARVAAVEQPQAGSSDGAGEEGGEGTPTWGNSGFSCQAAGLQEALWEQEARIQSDELGALKASQATLAQSLDILGRASRDRHSSVLARFECLEVALRELSDSHADKLEADDAKFELVHSRLAEHGLHENLHSQLDEFQKVLAEQKAELSAHQGMLVQRVDYLETTVGASSDKLARAVESLRSEFSAVQTSLLRLEQKPPQALEDAIADLHQRVDSLEGECGSALATVADGQEASRQRQAQQAREHEARFATHSDATEARLAAAGARLEHTVQVLTRWHETMADELRRLSGEVSQLQGTHGGAFEDHKVATDAVGHELQYVCARVSACERDCATIRAEQTKHRSSAQRGGGGSSEREEFGGLASVREEEPDNGGAARLELLEERLRTTHEKQSEELRVVRESVAAHTVELEGFASAHTSFPTPANVETMRAQLTELESELSMLVAAQGTMAAKEVVEREVRRLEKAADETARRSEQGLAGALKGLQEVRRVVEQETAVRFADAPGAAALEALEARRAALLEERLARVEKASGRRQEDQSDAMQALNAVVLPLAKRVGRLEKDLGEGGGQASHRAEGFLLEARGELEALSGRLAGCEAKVSSVDDLKKAQAALANENVMLEAHQASLHERLDHLENRLASDLERCLVQSQERCSKELEDTKAAFSSRHSSFEMLLDGTSERHERSFADSMAKVEAVHIRIFACEAHVKSLCQVHQQSDAELRGGGGRLSLCDRVARVEHLLGGLDAAACANPADQAAAEAGASKAAALGEPQKIAFPLVDRVLELERVLGHSAAAIVADVGGGDCAAFIGVGGGSGSRAGSKQAVGDKANQIATVVDRLALVEQTLGAAAAQQAGELAALRGKLDELHMQVLEEHASQMEVVGAVRAKVDGEAKARDADAALLEGRLDQGARERGECSERVDVLRCRVDGLEAGLVKTVDCRTRVDATRSELVVQSKKLEMVNDLQDLHKARLDRLEGNRAYYATSPDRGKDELDASNSPILLLQRLAALEQRAREAVEDRVREYAHSASESRGREECIARLGARLTCVEAAVGDTTGKQLPELAYGRGGGGQMQGRLSSGHLATSTEATVHDRLQHLEHVVGASASKRPQADVANPVGEPKARDASPASVLERLDRIEEAVGQVNGGQSPKAASVSSPTFGLFGFGRGPSGTLPDPAPAQPSSAFVMPHHAGAAAFGRGYGGPGHSHGSTTPPTGAHFDGHAHVHGCSASAAPAGGPVHIPSLGLGFVHGQCGSSAAAAPAAGPGRHTSLAAAATAAAAAAAAAVARSGAVAAGSPTAPAFTVW